MSERRLFDQILKSFTHGGENQIESNIKEFVTYNHRNFEKNYTKIELYTAMEGD